MVDIVLNKLGEVVDAATFQEAAWEQLKDSYNISDFIMPCCGSPAIPKTSPRGLQFFAHQGDECATAPETLWHIATKEAILKSLIQAGIAAKLEVPGKSKSGKWQADVYFEYQDRSVAIEIQHSYQHLRDYFKRQEKYASAGIECYWVLYSPRFKTLTNSICRHRLKNEFGNKWPQDLSLSKNLGQINNLPAVWFDDEDKLIKSPGFFSADVTSWVLSVLNKTFRFGDEGWRIY